MRLGIAENVGRALQTLLTIPAESIAVMHRPALFAATLISALGLAQSVLAGGGDLSVEMNHSRRIVLNGSVGNVIVGDPTIADVVMIDAHSVIVVGKGYGSTEVLAIDRDGHTLLNARVSVAAPSEGRVTVYRGPVVTEYSCSGRCQSLTPPGGGGGGGGTANPFQAVGNAVSGPAPAPAPAPN